MSSSKLSKIVVLKEDVDVQDFAETSLKSVNVLDGPTLMATDAMPEDDVVQTSQEMGFMVANLSTNEVKKFENDPNVEAVEDDITVYALAEGGSGTDTSLLEVDQSDLDLLEGTDQPMFASSDFQIEPEELQHAVQTIPAVDFTAEMDLMTSAGQYALSSGETEASVRDIEIPWDTILKILKCLAKCALSSTATSELPDMTTEQMNKLLDESGLGGLTDACKPSVAARERIPRGLRQILAPQAWRTTKGDAVRVAVVDTGIANRHPDLRVFGGASFVPTVTSWNDDQGHGTHVAGTIAALANGEGVIGAAPNAHLYAVKVLNRNGSGKLSWILNGLTWCQRNRMQVVNLSLGSRFGNHDPNQFSRAYERAGRALRQNGAILCAAAGNTPEPVGNPARCPSFMAVSAVDFRGRKASFSSFGPQVEICAPGVGIESTYPPATYRALSGTSMATPHVAAVAALIKARHPGWHGDRIRAHLMRTAQDLGRPGRDPFFGAGLVNAWRAVS